MRLEILTAEVLEVMNAEELFQLLQEHSADEFDKLIQKYGNEWDSLFHGERHDMEQIDAMIELHRRMRILRGLYHLKTIVDLKIEQIYEALAYDAKLKKEWEEEMKKLKAEVLGKEDAE